MTFVIAFHLNPCFLNLMELRITSSKGKSMLLTASTIDVTRYKKYTAVVTKWESEGEVPYSFVDNLHPMSFFM